MRSREQTQYFLPAFQVEIGKEVFKVLLDAMDDVLDGRLEGGLAMGRCG
jgi:hypothetical protein